MATFSEIKTTNPGAIPAATDLLVTEKADGNPAAYTLAEIATYVQGVVGPQWQTDAAHGCHLDLSTALPTMTHGGGVIPYSEVIRDSGFFTVDGVMTIPANVTKVQVVAQVETLDPNPTLMIIKNSDTTNPIAIVDCYGTYGQVVSPEFEVIAGDLIQIHCSDVTSLITKNCYFNLRTLEKTV